MIIPAPLDAREVKQRADFAAIAGRYTRLRRAGRQRVGLCPFHRERHPSFFLYPEKKVFYCFGCGARGDVFDFIIRAEGCNFCRALQIVAELSQGETSGSEPRSGSRSAASEGGAAPRAREAGSPHSQSPQDSRAHILAALDAADRRLARIAATNRAASVALATDCEPDRGAVCAQKKKLHDFQ